MLSPNVLIDPLLSVRLGVDPQASIRDPTLVFHELVFTRRKHAGRVEMYPWVERRDTHQRDLRSRAVAFDRDRPEHNDVQMLLWSRGNKQRAAWDSLPRHGAQNSTEGALQLGAIVELLSGRLDRSFVVADRAKKAHDWNLEA